MIRSRESFIRKFWTNINPDIRSTFTPEQIRGLDESLSICSPKNHPIDVRGTIPLFFTKYYFVYLMGRDRREDTQRVEIERRYTANMLGVAIVFIIISLPVIIFVFVALYLMKSALGIDIFPHQHLSDFFK